MKLTSEGAARLGRHESRGFPVGDFDFKPEDFDGCFQNGNNHIALTVEEANLLFNVIDGFFDLRLPTTKEIVALTKTIQLGRIVNVLEKMV